MKNACWKRPSASLLAMAAVLLIGVTNARADEVSFGEIPLTGVTIINVEDGILIFINQGGAEVRRPILEVRSIKVESVPELAKAEEQLEAKQFKGAIPSLTAAKAKARQPWLKTWIDARMVKAYDGDAKPVDAIRAYLTIYKSKADDGYLSQRPDRSINFLKADEKTQMLKEIDDAIKARGGEPPQSLASLRSAVDLLDVDAAAEAIKAAVAAGGDPTKIDVAPKSAIPLPRFLTNGTTDPATKALMAGDFETALKEADGKLESGEQGTLYMRLYQRGLALLYMGEKTKDEKMLKDAGLSFMRIVVYSPTGRYAGPAYIEAGRVHTLIGRADLARNLFDQATNFIEQDADPELYTRLDELKSNLPKTN